MSDAKSPRELLPPEIRSTTVVTQAAHLPPDDRRKLVLLERALHDMMARAVAGKVALRRITTLSAEFSSVTDAQGVPLLAVHVRVQQYGGTSDYATTETVDEATAGVS